MFLAQPAPTLAHSETWRHLDTRCDGAEDMSKAVSDGSLLNNATAMSSSNGPCGIDENILERTWEGQDV